MKLFKISQTMNRGYDTYDAAIVAAETEEEAQAIRPDGDSEEYWEWAAPKFVSVEYIGEAASDIKRGVVLASFNAG